MNSINTDSNSTTHNSFSPILSSSALFSDIKQTIQQILNPLMMNTIPHYLTTEILARVGSSSATDLYNVKATCKDLNKAGDDNYVYKHVSMENVPVVHWKKSEAISSFLKRCEENQNPEALYRRGMVEYFSRRELEHGRELLQVAANLGHVTATYVLGIILLAEDDNDGENRNQGIQILSKIMPGFRERFRVIRHCRNKSWQILHQIWINNNPIRKLRICDCNKPYRITSGWSDEECDEIFECEDCQWNHELIEFYKILKGR